MKEVTHYALQFIPANKLSLGIATTSLYWKTRRTHDKTTSNGISIRYQTMRNLLAKYHVTLHWDQQQQVPYTFYNNHQFNEFIFAENSRSFAVKLELAKKLKLNGFSLWRLGTEDPQVRSFIGCDHLSC